MGSEKQVYAVALFALKVPPGCAVEQSASGAVFGAWLARVDVSFFLRAAFSVSASEREAETSWLEFLRGHLPARDGWTCHTAKVDALLDFDEMIDRHDRGEALAPEIPNDGIVPPDEPLLM